MAAFFQPPNLRRDCWEVKAVTRSRIAYRLSLWLAKVCLTIVVGACAGAPRTRPLDTKPVAEGPGTIEGVRKQLEGRWTLVSLTMNSADGKSSAVDAGGELVSDAFGNLEVEYRLSDTGLKTLAALGIKSPNPEINTSGNVVIDTTQQRITYVGEDFQKRAFDPTLAAQRSNPFSLERVRYYTFGADGTLTLATRYDNGRNAAVSQWKKEP
jgi:hypothetical protein